MPYVSKFKPDLIYISWDYSHNQLLNKVIILIDNLWLIIFNKQF